MYCLKFGKINFKVDFTGEIEPGKYLKHFLIPESSFSGDFVTINITRDRIITSDQLQICGERFTDGNKVITPYAFTKNAISFTPSDWKTDQVNITVDSELMNENRLDLNQILCAGGFHEAFIYRKAIVLHASYITVDGEAILFSAPSGVGKSTQAELWKEYAGATIVNGDRTLVYNDSSRICAGGFSLCGSSDICANISAPLKAIVILQQALENKVLPMSKLQAYTSLLSASAFLHWNKEENLLAGEIISDIIYSVPVVKFGCKPDWSAVTYLQRYLNEL